MQIRVARADDAAEICVILQRSITELCAADHKNDPQILSRWIANKTPDNLGGGSGLHVMARSILLQ